MTGTSLFFFITNQRQEQRRKGRKTKMKEKSSMIWRPAHFVGIWKIGPN
jgi:hypothetical protein